MGGAGDATATSPLTAELVDGHGLHVATSAEGEHQILVVDEILDVDLTRVDADRVGA